jgi:CheY-like chemotaxis protein
MGRPEKSFTNEGTMLAGAACRGNKGLGGMSVTAAKRSVVLVVEDDFLIRICAVEMIEAEFDVVEAGNADEAIEILEAPLDIIVVFTDIQMPGSMDGLKLVAAIRAR